MSPFHLFATQMAKSNQIEITHIVLASRYTMLTSSKISSPRHITHFNDCIHDSMVILFEFKPPVITPQKHDPAQLKSTIMGQKYRKAHLRCVSAGPMQVCQAGLMLHEYYPEKPAPRRRRKGMEDTVIAYEPTSQRRRSSFGQSLAKLMPKKITTHGDPRAGHDDLLRLEGQIFQTL